MDVRGYFGIAMGVAGGLLLVDRLLALIERRRFLRTALRCDAKVVSLREFEIGGDQSSATGVYPTVQFIDDVGGVRGAELNVWFNEGKVKVGDRLPVLYQLNPEEKILYDGWAHGEALTKLFFGVVFLGGGAALLVWSLSAGAER